jgi:hypothetical protein
MSLRTRQDLYDIIKNEIQTVNPNLTDFEAGSVLDCLVGATSTGLSEVMDLVISQFNKTFIDLANGPEITGGNDDLENLAVDHFGSDFARPDDQYAVGVVTFSRANDDDGDCTIPAGTVVKTETNANGEAQSFSTLLQVVMTSTSINASVKAVSSGTKGNVDAAKIIVVESTLTDPSIVVTNEDAMAGGAAAQSDADYRETIRNLIQQLKGATAEAIQAKALTVSGVEAATIVEVDQTVIEYDESTEEVSGEAFRIPNSTLYVADANGEANEALISLVQTAIDTTRACGVKINVVGATAYEMDWEASITLNPGGPNYTELLSDPSMIEQSMTDYINNLSIGDGFDRPAANAALLLIWGPDGTDDITVFTSSVPSGSVAAVAGQKIVPGNVEIN